MMQGPGAADSLARKARAAPGAGDPGSIGAAELRAPRDPRFEPELRRRSELAEIGAAALHAAPHGHDQHVVGLST